MMMRMGKALRSLSDNLHSYIQLQRKSPLLHCDLLALLVTLLISLVFLGLGVPVIAFSYGEDEAGPSHEGRSSSGWTDLLGSSEESGGTSSSVNQRGARQAPAQEVAPPVVPYPYSEDEIIGGDSVESIQRRLLGRFPSPSAHEIQMARIEAEDLFEVKADICRVMAGLHPSGDWMVRGARALDNPRTATGEESLSKLLRMREDLQTGLQSATFRQLADRVPFRADEDQDSAA